MSSNQEIFLIIVGVAIMVKIIHWLLNRQKHQIIIVSDNCSECPFMRDSELVNTKRYGCSAGKSKRYYLLDNMNEDCAFGSKIEISIDRQ